MLLDFKRLAMKKTPESLGKIKKKPWVKKRINFISNTEVNFIGEKKSRQK